jgi:hypothetical protein
VRLFDTITGKPLGEPIKHSMEMYAISLNHFGSLADRKLLIIDRNRDLYIVAVGLHIAGKAVPPYKLGALTYLRLRFGLPPPTVRPSAPMRRLRISCAAAMVRLACKPCVTARSSNAAFVQARCATLRFGTTRRTCSER